MSPSLRLLPMFAMPLLLCITSSCGEEEAEIAPSYVKPSNTGPLDQFGSAVDWFGDVLMVGAPHEGSAAVGIDGDQQDDSAPGSGAVYRFYRPRLEYPDDPPHPPWNQFEYIKASNTGAGDRFGYSLARGFDGESLLVVGAPYESSAATGVNGDESDDSAPESGAAYVFRYRDGTLVQEAYLKASNTKAGARFGSSVAVALDTIVIGAPHEDGAGSGVDADQTTCCLAASGALYTFEQNQEGEWVQVSYIKSPNPTANAAFGHSMSTYGYEVAVGAPYGDEAVYLYSVGSPTPSPPARLALSSPGSGFGFSVSMWNEELAVGAPLGDTGAAYVFLRGSGGWVQQPTILASNGDTDDEFGYSVDISGRRLAVGAPGEASKARGLNGNGRDNSAPDSGAMYLFWDEYNDKPWRQEYYIKATNSAPGQRFGTSVSLREPLSAPLWDGAPAIGAPNEASDATGTDGDQSNERAPGSGAVFVYEGLSPHTPSD